MQTDVGCRADVNRKNSVADGISEECYRATEVMKSVLLPLTYEKAGSSQKPKLQPIFIRIIYLSFIDIPNSLATALEMISHSI